jgi:hypothetical protein
MAALMFIGWFGCCVVVAGRINRNYREAPSGSCFNEVECPGTTDD